MANALRLRRALFLSSALLSRSTAAAVSSTPLLRVPASSPSPAASHLFPQFGSRALHSSVSSPASYQSQRSNHQADDHIDENTILFEGCDYKHWLITMDFPKDPRPSPEEMVEAYVQTLAKVVGSVEEAKRRMYACSTTTYTGFQAEIDEETANKFEGMPGVVFVLPDSYIDPVNKEYGGDKYINGTIIPRPPPVQYGRQRRQRPQEGSGYNRQGPPQEGSGYNRQGPPQEGSGYNRQGPLQEGSGFNRQGPPQEGSGFNRQGPPREGQNFTPQQGQGPQQNYQPQQNYGPPQSYPSRGNQGLSQNYPPQQNYAPNQNYPPQQSYVPPPRQGERMDAVLPRSPDRFQGDRADNFPPPPSGVQYGRGGPGSYGQNPGGSFQGDRAGSPPLHQGNYNQGSDYSPRYQRTDNFPPPPPPPGVQYEHNPRGGFGNQSSDSYSRQANTSYGQGYAGPAANQPLDQPPQGGERYGAGQRDQRTYGPPTGLPGTDQGRY